MPGIEPESIAVLGATGAVGKAVCKQLSRMSVPGHAIVRESMESVEGFPALCVDFDQSVSLTRALRVQRVICCLGTTQAKSGRDGLRAVDRDLVLHCAERASRAGVEVFVAVSAMGANRHSPSFYSRTKGQMEAGMTKIRLDTVHLVRPSLLLADREESRPAESLGQWVAPIINPLLPRHYRAIAVEDVAKALIQLSGPSTPGVWVHDLPLAHNHSRRLDR